VVIVSNICSRLKDNVGRLWMDVIRETREGKSYVPFVMNYSSFVTEYRSAILVTCSFVIQYELGGCQKMCNFKRQFEFLNCCVIFTKTYF
jgi:hypothetical protein